MIEKRILITGGAGFIGINLIVDLQDNGATQITVVDDESMGSGARVERLGVRFVKGDIRDADLMQRLASENEIIVHLAADTRVMDSIVDSANNFDINVTGTFRVLEAARAAGVECVINASTGGAILGDATPPIHEDMPARPLAPYGAAKLAAEGYCSAFTGAYGLPTVSLRFSNVYGPLSFHKGSVVAHFFKCILAGEDLVIYGDGNQTRDFLFIGDLVKGVRQSMEGRARGVFQLGSGSPTTINNLTSMIREITGPDHPFDVRHASFRAGEVRESWCDISRAKSDLGFSPVMPLKQGLAETWGWFLENH